MGEGDDGSGAVAILIPALDEEDALPGVLAALPWDRLRHVVVADNGSTDGTAEVARAGGATVVPEPRRGYGSACLAGLRHLEAVCSPSDVVVFMDADHSDDPAVLPELVAPILDGRADLVLGVRTGAGTRASRSVPLHARMGNRLILGLVRLLFGLRFADLPPYRAIRLASLESLGMDDADFGWTLQMQLRAGRRGLRIREVAVPHRSRVAGRSKVSGSLVGSARAGVKMLYTIVKERVRPG